MKGSRTSIHLLRRESPVRMLLRRTVSGNLDSEAYIGPQSGSDARVYVVSFPDQRQVLYEQFDNNEWIKCGVILKGEDTDNVNRE